MGKPIGLPHTCNLPSPLYSCLSVHLCPPRSTLSDPFCTSVHPPQSLLHVLHISTCPSPPTLQLLHTSCTLFHPCFSLPFSPQSVQHLSHTPVHLPDPCCTPMGLYNSCCICYAHLHTLPDLHHALPNQSLDLSHTLMHTSQPM